MPTIKDTAERRQAIRQGAQRLAGFSRPRLASYLGVRAMPADPLVAQVYPLLALGEGLQVFLLASSDDEACLVDGPRHFLVKGRGRSIGAFTEEGARLAFFLKPPFAHPATLQCEAQVRLRGMGAQPELRAVVLQRQTAYAYTLDGHPASLVCADWQYVQLLAGPWEAFIPADPFWGLVLDAGEVPPGELFRSQIGIEHAARLLGRAPLTLKRHLDGTLPQAGPSREYPGFCRENLEEYLAYTDLFPQGLISSRQRQRWLEWREAWRHAYRRHVSELVDIPTS